MRLIQQSSSRSESHNPTFSYDFEVSSTGFTDLCLMLMVPCDVGYIADLAIYPEVGLVNTPVSECSYLPSPVDTHNPQEAMVSVNLFNPVS